MKYISGIVFLLLLYFESLATSVTVSGNVNGTWTADTVLVDGNLLVQAGELLVISPGTLVQFLSYFRIDVQVRILAQGIAGESILFTVLDTPNFYAQSQGRGGWAPRRAGLVQSG